MKEEAFRQQMRKVARMYGWTQQYHTHSSKFSDAGWPDEVWANRERKRIIFIEFKSEKGRVRPAQKEWIETLQMMGLEAAIWRPSDMDLIVEVLGPKQRSLLTGVTEVVDPETEGWVFPSELEA